MIGMDCCISLARVSGGFVFGAAVSGWVLREFCRAGLG